MAKYYGKIGYSQTVETVPGVFEDQITEVEYFGDILTIGNRWQTSQYVNDDLIINNRFSIMADGFAYQNFSRIKYITWMGEKWKVTSVEVSRPRLILTIGGVWNE